YYLDVLKIRRELAGNEAVDQFTPGRSYMMLADVLDKLQMFEEALRFRERTCQVQEEKGAEKEKLFESYDFWAWTCWKAYLETSDEDRKQAHLEKADELAGRALELRPGAR